MTGKPLLATAAALMIVPAAATLGVAAAASGTALPAVTALSCPLGTAGPGTGTGHGLALTAAQVASARTIYAVSARMGLPARAPVIAIATAMQESSLINLTAPAGGGSLGLFQQRPSQGWGTPAQLTDPRYASRAFYRHLTRVPHWQRLRLTVAAQDVQHSATPRAYGRWQALAQALVTTFDAAGAACGRTGSGLGASILAYARSQLGVPYQFGGGTVTGPTAGFNSAGTGQPGFDCSGLVLYAIYQATAGKLTLPHNAALQYRDPHIQHISYRQLQPGDLVFFPGTDGTPAQPGHVGIYAGNGLMIDAPFTGTFVRYDHISPGTTGVNEFIGGGRLIP